MTPIYLDHNATTPLCDEARRAMAGCLDEDFGNPSSIHAPGRRARELVERARAEVAALVGVAPDEIVLTSGGTEANNLALHALGPGARVITTAVEHPSVAEAAPPDAVRVPVARDGRLDPDDLARALAAGDGRPTLVSVQWANHETGTLQPIDAVAALCRARGAVLHVDAVQATGRVPVDLGAAGVDLASLSAHKFHGPKGAGALFVRRGLEPAPLLRGGHQERERRPGTENVPGAVGMGAAAALARAELPRRGARVDRLARQLEAGLLALAGARLCGAPDARAPGTVNVLFEGASGEALVQSLDLEGVAASTGAACSSGSLEPSPVLLAMGLAPAEARSAVRFSLGRGNRPEEVDQVLALLPRLLERVRRHEPAA